MNPSPEQGENLEKAERIAYLIAGHLRGTLTPAEAEELDDWITASDANLELFETLTDEDNIEMAMRRYQALEKGQAAALEEIKEKVGLTATRSRLRRLGPYLMAAAVLLLAAGVYIFSARPNPKPVEKPIAQTPRAINAGSSKAVLTLSDGRTLILDTASSGPLAQEGTVQITQADGRLSYTGTAGKDRYNEVATPRGGQYRVSLGDGTQVWLNAESRLRYPAAFAGPSRTVSLQGEGYFEVAKDPARPFVVDVQGPQGRKSTITVLGTHFNINAYSDGEAVIATLLEGSVQVQHEGQRRRLRPGEQAILDARITVQPVAAADAAAWKDGTFVFRNASIRTIGEQLKRWYDVEVTYAGTVPQHFNTTVSRAVPLEQLLTGLAGTGQVHYQLEGKKLILKP